MNRKQVIQKVDEIMETYCEGCFIKATLCREESKTCAHRFCIQQCTVGQQLRDYGKQLATKE